MSHKCHWPGCTKEVLPALWGCPPHWYALPKTLRDKVWATYRRGQEVTKTPSAAYVAVAKQVQEWIAAQSGGTVGSRNIGERVGAMLKSDEHTVWLIGYGTYQGEHVPPPEILDLGIPNPKLVMDDGTVVWGCECWWGPEREVRGRLDGRKVVMVDMAQERASREEHGK